MEFWRVSSLEERLRQDALLDFSDGKTGNRGGYLQPFIQGTPAGTTFAVNPANQYTLRVRVHSPECERVLAIYRSFGDSGPLQREASGI